MTDELKPALSAEEWQQIRDASKDPRPVSQFMSVQKLAVANHTLPDNSPYKITREDVEALDFALAYMLDNPMTSQSVHSRVGLLAAKLEALLPPEMIHRTE